MKTSLPVPVGTHWLTNSSVTPKYLKYMVRHRGGRASAYEATCPGRLSRCLPDICFLKGSAAPYTSGKVSRISVVNGLSNSSSECSLGAAASSGSVRRQTALVTVQQSEDVLLCLRSVYKDDHAQFKSSQQRAAVENVLHTGSNLLVILPTGCGKSLVFFTYAVKYANTTSLLVVPTISLKQDLARRAQNLGVSCSCTPLTVTREQLVIVTPEAVVQGSEVTELLTRLHSSGQLGKIFVDEAHMFSTECGYRPLYRQLPGPLGSFSSPLVLMKATAPQWIVEDLMQNFFGPAHMLYSLVIRQTTSRPNLAYTFDESGRTSNLVAAGDIEITSAPYSGQQEANENASNFILWREGQVKIMVATSAFGVGIDYAHVRQVISFGLCYSVEDYAQMMGTCIIIILKTVCLRYVNKHMRIVYACYTHAYTCMSHKIVDNRLEGD